MNIYMDKDEGKKKRQKKDDFSIGQTIIERR